ncbi:hypothetical protein BRADI_1g24406v3 [Brachypodium distachyon]|uniref:Uncharacterized protein n=1 Tax=Brachypodium distachyon TaxID=15368 RepID=A0A2K2DKW0_BRADI|nr:hypothetical protein BRADI_1g24406v3 [Brachypodium distachyon]
MRCVQFVAWSHGAAPRACVIGRVQGEKQGFFFPLQVNNGPAGRGCDRPRSSGKCMRGAVESVTVRWGLGGGGPSIRKESY